MDFHYDIIVVGGGHAGCEAAHAAAIMGAKTLIITMDMTKLAQMSCNPAMGGIAKGQAMWSPRAQCDRQKFTVEWRKVLEKTDNLNIWQEQAQALLIEGAKVV